MTRTLPWLQNGSKQVVATTRERPSKRQRLLEPDPDSNSDTESTALPRAITSLKRNAPPSPKKQKALRAAERSPSTSPPPEPPISEPMRPGLSFDDIYIMVEDEFLSIARTFTAHLHHAEYVRLKNEAKHRNSATISHISRPVDSITSMRAETKKKKAAELQEARTKAALGSIKGASKRPVTAASDDDSEFDENEGQDQPWEGTQLQCFMTTSPKKALTSLTGLQGVTSHTRAAAGYERPEQKREHTTPGKSPTTSRQRPAADAMDDETSEDDDDLDAPSRAHSRAPVAASRSYTKTETQASPPPKRPKPKAKPPSPPRQPPRRSLLDMSPLPETRPTLPTKPPGKHRSQKGPGAPIKQQPVEEARSSIRKGEIMARRQRIEAKKEKGRKNSGGGMGADEIPIFLV